MDGYRDLTSRDTSKMSGWSSSSSPSRRLTTAMLFLTKLAMSSRFGPRMLVMSPEIFSVGPDDAETIGLS